MKPSFFDRPNEIGAVTYRRLFDPIGRESLIVFGVTPGVVEHQKIVEGFLATAAAEKRPFQVVFVEEYLDALSAPSGTEIVQIRFNSAPQKLAELIRAKTSNGERALLYTASVLSSHLIRGNPMQRFEENWGQPVYTISTVGINLRRDQELRMDPPCVGSAVDNAGTAGLGCAALLKGRQFYRKNLDNTRLVALMDQCGRSDLLLFVSLPPKS